MLRSILLSRQVNEYSKSMGALIAPTPSDSVRIYTRISKIRKALIKEHEKSPIDHFDKAYNYTFSAESRQDAARVVDALWETFEQEGIRALAVMLVTLETDSNGGPRKKSILKKIRDSRSRKPGGNGSDQIFQQSDPTIFLFSW